MSVKDLFKKYIYLTHKCNAAVPMVKCVLKLKCKMYFKVYYGVLIIGNLGINNNYITNYYLD